MKTSNAPQTAREALMVMREAFRDQAAVGVSSAGELVYVNPDRPGNTSIDVASPDEVRNVLTAKIENELARSHTSIEQLRTHIKKTLPSLAAVDFRADNPAIPVLLCEWEELLKQTDPVRSAEFQTDKRMMARREKLVDFLRNCLPAEGELTPLPNNHYEARISASVDQQQQILGAFEVNQYRDIDTALNITKQLVKDSPRLNDLRILMPARAEAKREVSHLHHAPANQFAAALQQLTRLRHTRQSTPDKSLA